MGWAEQEVPIEGLELVLALASRTIRIRLQKVVRVAVKKPLLLDEVHEHQSIEH